MRTTFRFSQALAALPDNLVLATIVHFEGKKVVGSELQELIQSTVNSAIVNDTETNFDGWMSKLTLFAQVR